MPLLFSLLFILQAPVAEEYSPVNAYLQANPEGDRRGAGGAFSVIANKGSNVRQKPSTRSSVVGQLRFGDEVEVVAKTTERLSLEESGVSLTGSWVKVKGRLLERDKKTGKFRRDDEGRLIRKEGTGFVFNGFLAPVEYRWPDPQDLCGARCKEVRVSFVSPEHFRKVASRDGNKIENKRQEKVGEGVKVLLQNKKSVVVKANAALLKIDGGAALSPLGFVKDLPLLSWSGHMADGFVVLDENTGAIAGIFEGFSPVWSPSQKSLAYRASNGETDHSWLEVHFSGRPRAISFEQTTSWCPSGAFVFEDDKTLLASVMRAGDCGNPEYDALRKTMQVFVRISVR